jgi:hypothetical protein
MDPNEVKLTERIATLESWQNLHPLLHQGEAKAVTLAYTALEKEVASLNDVRKDLATKVDEESYRREHERLRSDIQSLRETRSGNQAEVGITEKFLGNPLIAAVAGALIAYLLLVHK